MPAFRRCWCHQHRRRRMSRPRQPGVSAAL